MNESIQRAISSLQTKRAELDVVSVVMRPVAPRFFGDAKTVAARVLGS